MIPPECDGVPVQDILREHGFSRRLLIGLKKIPGSVRLDSEPVYLVVRAQAGQRLYVDLPHPLSLGECRADRSAARHRL